MQAGPFKPSLWKRIETFGKVSEAQEDECLLYFHATRRIEGDDPVQHSVSLSNYRLLKLDYGRLACEIDLMAVVNATHIPKVAPGWDQLLVNVRDDRGQVRHVNVDIYYSKACVFFRDVLNEIGREFNPQISMPDFVRGTLRRPEQLPDKSRYPPEEEEPKEEREIISPFSPPPAEEESSMMMASSPSVPPLVPPSAPPSTPLPAPSSPRFVPRSVEIKP